MELNISRQETLFIKGIAILFVILSHMGVFDCGGSYRCISFFNS